MEIADKWTIIDIEYSQVSGGLIDALEGFEKYDDKDGNESLYAASGISEIFRQTGESFDIVTELETIEKLAAENDAFYFRIINFPI